MPRAGKRSFNGYSPRPSGPGEHTHVRRCEWPGCDKLGEHRAPKSRNELGEYKWYCLDHVREVNRAWNYYADMTEKEIEAEIRKDTIGRRPTWPFGTRAATMRFMRGQFTDSFGFFEDEEEAEPETAHRPWPAGSPQESALAALDLTPPVTVDEVKARYKQLVKRYHPDANGGDKASEERFKQINEAYHTVIQSLTT